MSFNQIATSVSILSSGLKGYQAISLTNFTMSAESLIASGSAIEIANAFFLADGNITPNASSWTAVGTGNTAYITLTPSGSAGVQILSAAYSADAPIWSTSKQAWYSSAGSLTRYIGSVQKNSATKYDGAMLFRTRQGEFLQVRTYDIGEWNMQATGSLSIAHGLKQAAVRSVQAMIWNDVYNTFVQLNGYSDSSGVVGGKAYINEGNIALVRNSGGIFDSAAYNATAGTVPSRGIVTVWFDGFAGVEP